MFNQKRKLAFTSLYDATDINQWSGTPFFLTQALAQKINIQYIQTKKKKSFKYYMENIKKSFLGKKISHRYQVDLLKSYALQVSRILSKEVDFILSPQIQPIAYLDCDQPIVLYTDALYSSLLGFHT